MADQLDFTTPEGPGDVAAACQALRDWCQQQAEQLHGIDPDGAGRLRRLEPQVFDQIVNDGHIPTPARLYPLLADAVARLGHHWDDTTRTVQPLHPTSRDTPGTIVPPPAAAAAGEEVGEREPHRWFLTADELAATRHKLAQISRRATTRGFTGQLELTAEPAVRSWTPAPGAPQVTVHGFEVTITGQPPSYQGWRFLAAVDNVNGQPILRYPPGTEAADQVPNDQVRPRVCDHCHTVRDRTRTLLVRHDDTGELKQVGSSCLKDFLGWTATPVFLDVDDVRSQLDRGGGRSGSGPWELAGVLAYSWAIITEHGWVPASAATSSRTPSRDLVAAVLLNSRDAGDILRSISHRLADAPAMAQRIITDLTDQLAGETAGYGGNLKALLAAGLVGVKQLGLAVSAVNAWERNTTTPQVAERAEPRVLQHVGKVGEKVTVTGTITTLAHLPGYQWNSPSQRLIVLDCGDAIAKIITTARWSDTVDRGDTITLTGTVKAHDTWQDIPQTVLTRCTPTNHTPARAMTPEYSTATAPAVSPPTNDVPDAAAEAAGIITPEYSTATAPAVPPPTNDAPDAAAEAARIITPEYSLADPPGPDPTGEPVVARWETVSSGPPQSRFRDVPQAAVCAPQTALTLF